jgi:hypothetical protein
MTATLYGIAIFWIAIGTLLVLYTEKTMEYLKRLFFIKRVRLLAILPIAFGTILIAGAFVHTQIFWLCFALGLLSLLKGLYFLAGPVHQIKAMLEWWFFRASSVIIRLCALIILILGIAVMSNL